MIDDIVEDLTNRLNLTPEQSSDLKVAIASYALAAVHDQSVRLEAMEICQVELGD